MFGYVRPSFHQLSDREQQRFRALYCGLCRTLGERYGTAARFILNYDFTFLSALLSAGVERESLHKRCIAHPMNGREYFPSDDALALAADCSVILAWWQMQDAVSDERGGKALAYRGVSAVLKGAYKKARALRPDFDRCTREQLEKLRTLEEEKCPSLDQAADSFARLLQGISCEVGDPVKRRVLEQLLYHLGRWIYLIDAVDDLEKDFSSGSYNPLIYRFSLEQGALTVDARRQLVLTLDHSIRLMAAAFELWDFGVWGPVIRSTVYEGLFCVGNAVLEGKFNANDMPFFGKGRDEEQL